MGNVIESSIATLEPFLRDKLEGSLHTAKTPIFYVETLPLNWSFDVIYEKFSKYGGIKEIRNRLGASYKFFETWIIYVNTKDALRALKEFSLDNMNANCSIVDEIPRYLDLYRPPILTEDPEQNAKIERSPHPPRWLILTTRSERGNLFKVKNFINQKIGQLKRPDITRFGRNSFLVNAKSDGQAAMLLNLRLDPEGLVKEIKPHFNFSYARGVIFNEDLHELADDEILDLCPEMIWKIFKVPRSSMIILTFVSSVLPTEIILESEIMRIRPYNPRVLQCFNCYGFGHASRVCTRGKICLVCSQPEHGDCSRLKVCANCKEGHHARDKNCKTFKKEQEALLKANTEHISVGHAKKLLAKRHSYSDVVKASGSSTTISIANVISPATNAGDSQASHTEAHRIAAGKSSRASSGGVPRAPSAGAPRTPSAGAPRASSGGGPRASSGGAPQASSGGAPRAASGGASQASSSGALKKSSSEVTHVSSKALQGSSNAEIQSGSQCSFGSGTRSVSLNDLDEFSLPGSSPGIESLPDPILNSPMVTVHRSNDDEEMEALAVRQKRARTPSPQLSSRSSSQDTSFKKDIRVTDGSSSKKSSIARSGRIKNKDKNASGKISLSRPQIPKSKEPNKKFSKSE